MIIVFDNYIVNRLCFILFHYGSAHQSENHYNHTVLLLVLYIGCIIRIALPSIVYNVMIVNDITTFV